MDNSTVCKKLAKKYNIDLKMISTVLPHATSEIIREMKSFNNLIIDVNGLFRWYYKRTGKSGVNDFKDYCLNKYQNHLINGSPIVFKDYGFNNELTDDEYHLFMEQLDKLFIQYEKFTDEKISKRADKLVYKKELQDEYNKFNQMGNK